MPVASLQHSGRPISEHLDNHKIPQVALANPLIIQEADSSVNLLRHRLRLSVPLSQPNPALVPVILPAASLAQNLQQVSVFLDRATLLRRPSKVGAFSVLLEEQLAASVQELALGPDLAVGQVYLVATTTNSSNSRSLSHLVGQLPPLERVSGRAAPGSAPASMLQTTPAVAYSAPLARPTLPLGKHSSSQLSKTHSAALGLKIRIRPITSHPSEVSVTSSNKSKSQADCLEIRT